MQQYLMPLVEGNRESGNRHQSNSRGRPPDAQMRTDIDSSHAEEQGGSCQKEVPVIATAHGGGEKGEAGEKHGQGGVIETPREKRMNAGAGSGHIGGEDEDI